MRCAFQNIFSAVSRVKSDNSEKLRLIRGKMETEQTTEDTSCAG